MYGAQAYTLRFVHKCLFENDVEMYGAQALAIVTLVVALFENDVEMYGAQASQKRWC